MDFVKKNLFNKLEKIVSSEYSRISLMPYGSRIKKTSIFGSDLECAVLIAEEQTPKEEVIEGFKSRIESLNIDFYKAFIKLFDKDGVYKEPTNVEYNIEIRQIRQQTYDSYISKINSLKKNFEEVFRSS